MPVTLLSISARSSVDRALTWCLGGHGFKFCWGLRFFLCSTLVTYSVLQFFWVDDCAVIDEIQMIQDNDRGWAWSRALLGEFLYFWLSQEKNAHLWSPLSSPNICWKKSLCRSRQQCCCHVHDQSCVHCTFYWTCADHAHKWGPEFCLSKHSTAT